jgi:signal transduction histidine kinase/DNA-binding response OmpR family regulator
MRNGRGKMTNENIRSSIKDMENGNQKINILMVDDNPSNLLSLETILESPDRNLVRASSGEEALRFLLDCEAAVILLDVQMPIIDGLETAALIRGRERTRDLPIIFLTAHDSAGRHQLTQGYKLGAVDYIIKPIDPEALKSKVAVFVELFKKTAQVKRQAELLRQKNIELEYANIQRLLRLINLGQQLAVERDPELVLATLCDEARDILLARYATLGVLEEDGVTVRHFFTSGLDHERAIGSGMPPICQRLLSDHFESKRSIRFSPPDEVRQFIRLFPEQPPVKSFLGATLLQHDRVRGWLYLADKHSGEEFSEADEHFAVTLAQAMVFYENARLYAELQRHAGALEQEIVERKQAEKERGELLVREQAARRESETANRLKDEFLATVSHELRAPLNAILGWTTLIRNGKLVEDKEEQALETIERSARAQKKLIDDLLDVSRIITGKLRLDIRVADLVSIIQSAVESARPAADAKGVHLQIEVDPATCPFQGDPNRIQQVIWNLLSNAVKFTPMGGSVTVRLRRLNEHIEIVVSDTGIGIAREFIPYVFERFRQADGSSTRKHGGLGLGLAIVRHLVEMHGGAAKAESAGVGQGASFTVILPLAAPISTLRGMEISTPDQKIVLSDRAPKLTGLRVLVVDDQPDARDLLATILHLSGAKVQTSGSVTEAINALITWQPEIVITDIAMPNGDGFELIRRIRELEPEGDGRMPIIALTANAGAEDRIRVLAAGFQLHLTKPVEPDELVVSVASLTGRLKRTQSLNE